MFSCCLRVLLVARWLQVSDKVAGGLETAHVVRVIGMLQLQQRSLTLAGMIPAASTAGASEDMNCSSSRSQQQAVSPPKCSYALEY